MHCRHSSPASRKCARPSKEIASGSLFLVPCHHRTLAKKRPKSGEKVKTRPPQLLPPPLVTARPRRPLLTLKQPCWSLPQPILEKLTVLPFRKKNNRQVQNSCYAIKKSLSTSGPKKAKVRRKSEDKAAEAFVAAATVDHVATPDFKAALLVNFGETDSTPI